MRFSQSAFAVITVIFFLWTLAIFVAGSLIFLNVQIYNSLYLTEGIWVTGGVIIAEISIIFFLFLLLIRRSFFKIFKPKEKSPTTTTIRRLEEKVVLSFVIYELLKYLYEKNRKKV